MDAHMAGSGPHAFRPVHAHILLAGSLSMFAWAFYIGGGSIRLVSFSSFISVKFLIEKEVKQYV
ncbi:hypothetical protein [Siminovitchia sp. 179-K 8D1 HS]|uniref:hypothetical protein n=1 Tax=Siminovitchia sp. 179-K 8D1 HS TaxID=3142385 RepID=UPI00399F028A